MEERLKEKMRKKEEEVQKNGTLVIICSVLFAFGSLVASAYSLSVEFTTSRLISNSIFVLIGVLVAVMCVREKRLIKKEIEKEEVEKYEFFDIEVLRKKKERHYVVVYGKK